MGIHVLSEGKMEDTYPGDYLHEVLDVVDETEVKNGAMTRRTYYTAIYVLNHS